MRSIMDEMEYERQGDTNVVRMRKFRIMPAAEIS